MPKVGQRRRLAGPPRIRRAITNERRAIATSTVTPIKVPSVVKGSYRIQTDAVEDREVWCIFDNTTLGDATRNALELCSLLARSKP
jgi:hypothetical protein